VHIRRELYAMKLECLSLRVREIGGKKSKAAVLCRYTGGYWEARDKGDWSAIPPDVQQCIVP